MTTMTAGNGPGRLCGALRPGSHLLMLSRWPAPRAEPSEIPISTYLWAMGSGRPRTAEELTAMCLAAGFSAVREFKTPFRPSPGYWSRKKAVLRRLKPLKNKMYLLFDSLYC